MLVNWSNDWIKVVDELNNTVIVLQQIIFS